MINTRKLFIPSFLVGRARSQWKGVLLRNTSVEQATVCVFTIDDVMGDIATNESAFSLAA